MAKKLNNFNMLGVSKDSEILKAIKKVTDFRQTGIYVFASIHDAVEIAGANFKKLKAAFATEDIFFGNRSPNDVGKNDFSDLENLAKSLSPMRDIILDDDIESLETRFRQLVGIERTWDNLETSRNSEGFENHKQTLKSVEAINRIEQLSAKIQIKIKKFYIIKSIYGNIDSKTKYKMQISNFNDVVFPEFELRKEYIRQQIKLLFAEAAETVCLEEDDFNNFAKEIFADISGKKFTTWTIPDEAPQYYKDRKDKTESSYDFLIRVWRTWLPIDEHDNLISDKDRKNVLFVTRGHIKNLDPSLYNAIYRQGFNKDLDQLLPKTQGMKLEDLSKPASQILAEKKATRAAAQRRWREKSAIIKN